MGMDITKLELGWVHTMVEILLSSPLVAPFLLSSQRDTVFHNSYCFAFWSDVIVLTTTLGYCVHSQDMDAIYILLSRNHNPNGIIITVDEQHTVETFLMKACEHENFEMAELLLQHGADPSLSIMGFTVLEFAMQMENEENSIKFLSLFLKYGASKNKQALQLWFRSCPSSTYTNFMEQFTMEDLRFDVVRMHEIHLYSPLLHNFLTSFLEARYNVFRKMFWEIPDDVVRMILERLLTFEMRFTFWHMIPAIIWNE